MSSHSARCRSHQLGVQRLAALRFLAALASRLGRTAVAPYLPLMLRPLYRITEAASGNPAEVRRRTSSISRQPSCIHSRTFNGLMVMESGSEIGFIVACRLSTCHVCFMRQQRSQCACFWCMALNISTASA